MTTELDQQVLTAAPLRKYYTPKMIRVGTFLGGPMATGYFIGQNYKAFGQDHRVPISWISAVLVTCLLAVIVALLPDNSSTNTSSLRYLIPLIYSWAALGLVNYLQGSLITAHVSAGGTNYGWGRTILISLIGCVVTLAILFAVVFTLFVITTTVQPVNSN